MDWDLCPSAALAHVDSSVIIDMRSNAEFRISSLEGSLNFDIGVDSRPNPYKDPSTLTWLFDVLSTRFLPTDTEFGKPLEGKQVTILSKDGHASRLASVILRKRGIEAYSVLGGVDAMKAEGLWPTNIRAQL
jgi:rhodanese-related sulfurtransferase